MKLSLVFLLVPIGLLAQESRTWKFNPFIGSGVTTAWSDGSRSVVSTAGMAVIVPITKRFFARPLVGTGAVLPIATREPFRVAQIGTLAGYRVIRRTSILAGFAETMQFPKTGAVYLPTFVTSTATRICGAFGIYTPIMLNSKGWGISVQCGFMF